MPSVLGTTNGGRRTHCPVCQAMIDPFGGHQVGCGGDGDRIHSAGPYAGGVRRVRTNRPLVAEVRPLAELPSLVPRCNNA